MGLKSAYDDLRDRTLRRVEGLWGKLTYVADSRSPEGRYEHWGFERAYGPDTTQTTFAEAHRSLLDSLLRTRIGRLQEDLELSSGVAGTSPASYVSNLSAGLRRLLPAECSRATELHLTSVLKTLSCLERQRPPAPQTASQPQPPGQSLPPLGDV